MKKISKFLLIILILLVIITPTITVSAKGLGYDKTTSDEIREKVIKLSDVKDCQVIVYGKHAGVAVKTEPIFLKQQKEKLTLAIKDIIKETYPKAKEIYISYDLDIFLKVQKIKPRMDEGESMFSLRKDLLEIYKGLKR